MKKIHLLYTELKKEIQKEFPQLVHSIIFIGGSSLCPNKLRVYLKDHSFVDIWLSLDGSYSYHWECRAQRGVIYRWDNAPDYPNISSFPNHFHNGSDKNIEESKITGVPLEDIKIIFKFIDKQKSIE